jgi:hypothetical protein
VWRTSFRQTLSACGEDVLIRGVDHPAPVISEHQEAKQRATHRPNLG